MEIMAAAIAAFLSLSCNQVQAIGDYATTINQATEEAYEETYYEEYYEEPYYEEAYYGGSYESDGFQNEGVRDFEGRTETWYSSNQAYHYRTSEWSVDDEGYYRTDDGYYVVAASDMPEGTVFETSKGEAIVLDSGCDEGVTDFYVAF